MFNKKMMTALVLAFTLNFAFAAGRLSPEKVKEIKDEIVKGVEDSKKENTVLTPDILLHDLKEELDEEDTDDKGRILITDEEKNIIIKEVGEEIDDLKGVELEKEFIKESHEKVDELASSSSPSSLKAGQICLGDEYCEKGLECLVDQASLGKDGKNCKKEASSCQLDSDCCSGSCNPNTKSCDPKRLCFRVTSEGNNCVANSQEPCKSGLECSPRVAPIISLFLKENNNCENLKKNCACQAPKECGKSGEFTDKNCCENGSKPINDFEKNGRKGKGCLDLNRASYIKKNNSFLSMIVNLVISSAEAQTTTAPDAKTLSTELAQKFGAFSTSPEDLTKALSTYTMTADDQAKLKTLISLDSSYQKVQDKADQVAKDAQQAATDAAAAAAVQVAADNAKAYQEVNSNRSKYEHFQAKSLEAPKRKVVNPVLEFPRKSNFETCDIKFRDDYYNFLKQTKPDATSRLSMSVDGGKTQMTMMDMEMALLGFDYVLLGDGVNDYWTKSSSVDSSVYGRLKVAAKTHADLRHATNIKIDNINHKLTCMCLDVKGFKNITDEAKKSFFQGECEEYAKYADPSISFDELEGDASGVKSKRLLVVWTQNLETFNEQLTVDNTPILSQLAEIKDWTEEKAQWNETIHKKYDLFGFTLQNPKGNIAALGAILGALLAAAVIAVLGGFATTSILSTWATMGIIVTVSLTTGTGIWLIASLKGAWITKRPEVSDKFIKSYSCGKKVTCHDYTRELYQPWNEICKVHTSSNACIKNFVVLEEDGVTNYVVDPWIPVGVDKSKILRDASERTYAEKMEDGFQLALAHMKGKAPAKKGKKGGGSKVVSENYMKKLFIDETTIGKYTPQIGTDANKYLLTAEIVKEIKEKAKAYAIAEKVFLPEDTKNLEAFAEYAYQFHFLLPKITRPKEISYPTAAMSFYMEVMTFGVAAAFTDGATRAADQFRTLNENYLSDYINTLGLYKCSGGAFSQDDTSVTCTGQINQMDPVKAKLLDDAIAKAKSDLSKLKNLSGILNGANAVAGQFGMTQMSGGSTAAAGALTSDQQAFVNAIGTARKINEDHASKLASYNKKLVAAVGPANAAAIAAGKAKMFAVAAKPLSMKKGALSGFFGGAAPAGGLVSPEVKGLDTTNVNSHTPADYSYGSGYNSSFGAGSGGSRTAGKIDDAPKGEAKKAVEDEDEKRLAEAIDARNRNKDKYKSNEEDSLFEKVTNAYIRNYDKVLNKKTDKDVEQK